MSTAWGDHAHLHPAPSPTLMGVGLGAAWHRVAACAGTPLPVGCCWLHGALLPKHPPWLPAGCSDAPAPVQVPAAGGRAAEGSGFPVPGA